MKEEDKRICPTCGTKYSATVSFCPVCILHQALNSGGDSIGPSLGDLTHASTGPASDRFENYQVLKAEDGTLVELGRGAMGVTYKAFDVDLRCPVTLKVINERYLHDEMARLRFIREARAAARVRHPNVASVFHLGQSGDNYFYAMEFVEGETLANLIERLGRLEVKLALQIATQVAAGLVAVHKQRLVHRDIKPTNIMVTLEEEGTPVVKIIDLGLAKALDEPPANGAISVAGAFAGTPEFASPEQFAGFDVDIRSDLYSLGVTLWETLTGHAPFRGSLGEVMSQHQHAPLPIEQLKGIPQPIVLLLEILLEKDPARRFQSPSELLKVMPAVAEAVEGRHPVTRQSLRTIAGGSAMPSNKARGIWAPLRASAAAWRGRGFLWPIIALLLVAGGVMLMTKVFFKTSRHAIDGSTPPRAAANTPGKSIAVLPFESLSDNKSDVYFADGVQDEILSKLAKVSQLRVISRTSVMAYRPSGSRDLRSIANALEVSNVVEGTVRREDNRVRITIELIDARTDETLWSDSYDRNLTDIFAIQSDIAQMVASKLSARLSPQERRGIEEKPTSNLGAFDLYLQAKELLGKSSFLKTEEGHQGLLAGIRLLEETTQKDPGFALAYCLMAKAHDWLYADGFDNTPERRALGDAAINEALRLRPNLPEVHLARAFHSYVCYRDYEGARVQIALAARDLPNSPDLIALGAYLDRRQGQWEKSTRGLETAATFDPRNTDLLAQLAVSYAYLRRYGDYERICRRLIELEPGEPYLNATRAQGAFFEKADLTSYRAAVGAIPSSLKNDATFASLRFKVALLARDWTAAKDVIGENSNPEFYLFDEEGMVPRGCLEIWLALLKGDRPTMAGAFAAAREQLNQKFAAHPGDVLLLSASGLIDAALGRKPEAIQEATRAVEISPIAKDAVAGPLLVTNLAIVYARTDEQDLAFQQLAISVKTPGGVSYGELRLDPAWDPLRKDPRFAELVARLAPHE